MEDNKKRGFRINVIDVVLVLLVILCIVGVWQRSPQKLPADRWSLTDQMESHTRMYFSVHIQWFLPEQDPMKVSKIPYSVKI